MVEQTLLPERGVEEDIVVSSYNTFEQRNRPRAQTSWRINTKNMTKADASRQEHVQGLEWEHSLHKMFGIVICDEGHLLKTVAAKSSIAVQCLKADFHIISTASPLPDGILDWKGYMPLIESLHADQWWSRASLPALGVEEDVDPFSVPDNHPAAKLRYTTRAVKDFVMPAGVSSVDKGHD